MQAHVPMDNCMLDVLTCFKLLYKEVPYDNSCEHKHVALCDRT